MDQTQRQETDRWKVCVYVRVVSVSTACPSSSPFYTTYLALPPNPHLSCPAAAAAHRRVVRTRTSAFLWAFFPLVSHSSTPPAINLSFRVSFFQVTCSDSPDRSIAPSGPPHPRLPNRGPSPPMQTHDTWSPPRHMQARFFSSLRLILARFI